MQNNKLKLSTFVKIVVTVIIIILIIIYLIIVNQTISDTTSIYQSTAEKTCSDSKYCFNVITIFSDGWGRWKLPVINVPILSFTAGDKSYINGDRLSLTCPINYNLQESQLLTKLKLLLGQVNINQCKINKL